MKKNKVLKGQSSFELLMTLSFGLAILLPLVVIAFLQLSNSNASLTSIESQQAASKLANVASLVGSQGPPSKQLVRLQIPPGVKYIYVGTTSDGVGHEITFVINSQDGQSYVTAYTPANVSGTLGGLVLPGSYLVNVSAQAYCPSNLNTTCVYMSPGT